MRGDDTLRVAVPASSAATSTSTCVDINPLTSSSNCPPNKSFFACPNQILGRCNHNGSIIIACISRNDGVGATQQLSHNGETLEL
mmetsp:Transcript_18343/g.31272  ORF Transcript_18343/g.31272 Transcript_18343/m.31272 type:complete len:85 (-) Transcript_18343:184-438(-)